jgi:hypothetical protein
MRTALLARLTPEQKERLIEFAVIRAGEVNAGMENWRAKLAKYERQADDDFSDRAGSPKASQSILDLGGNKSLNMVRGVARYMRGRCSGDISGGSPWFFAKAEGLEDEDLAEGMQKHFDFKLRQADYRRAIKDAIGAAIDLGTSIIKTTWKVVAEPYERLASVFLGPDGEPVLTPEGDYIEAEDESLSIGEDGQSALYQPQGADAINQPLPPILGALQERLITEDNVKYRGLCGEQVSYKNFLAPRDVERLEDADLVGHFYDRQLFDLKADYDPEGKDEDLAPIWDLLSAGQTQSRTGDKEAKRDETGGASAADDRNPWVKIHELRLRFAPFDDGVVRRVYLVINLETRSVIHADYLGNITPGGDLDMHPIVVNRVPGRWYGRGYYEVYEMLQEMIDGKLNAVLFRNSYNADPMKIADMDATEETQADGKIIITPGKVFRRRKNMDPQAKVLEIIEIPDLDTRTWELMQLFMQILQQDSGVTAAAQGDPGALPSVSTATGTNAILASGSTMHQLVIDELRDGLEPELAYAMRLLYSRQDRDETYSYMQGGRSVKKLLALSHARKLRGLYLHVTLTLTRIKNQEMRQSALAAINSFVQYFTLPPIAQISLRPLYMQAAKGFEFENADAIFPLPQPVLPPLSGQPPPDEGAAPAPAMTPAGPLPMAPAAMAAPINISTTGAAPASPLPVNVIPSQPPANQAAY